MMEKYSRGSYNKMNDIEQWIRISEGCPNNCEFCRETRECGIDPELKINQERNGG